MTGEVPQENDRFSLLEGHRARARIEEVYLPAAQQVVESYRQLQERDLGELTPRFAWYDFEGSFTEFSHASNWRGTEHYNRAYYVVDRLGPEPDPERLALDQWESGQIPSGIGDTDAWCRQWL